MSQQEYKTYYVPAQSAWPIVGAIALFLIAVGAGNFVLESTSGKEGYGGYILTLGLITLMVMLIGWFHDQIKESMSGLYSEQLSHSYRQGMLWFIFSEVMFFAAFFGALFYARVFAVPWLGGASNNASTHEVLWPSFEAVWPLVTFPDGGVTEAMGPMGLPLLNTAILILSSVTCHFAHVGLETNNRKQLKTMLTITVLLGVLFLFFQVEEYVHAYRDMGLTLQSGVYGNTFFLLTGFHGLHVTLGTIMLFIMLLRILKNHFTPEEHFAFAASSWYWHFVDAVWLMLFFLVYIF